MYTLTYTLVYTFILFYFEGIIHQKQNPEVTEGRKMITVQCYSAISGIFLRVPFNDARPMKESGTTALIKMKEKTKGRKDPKNILTTA